MKDKETILEKEGGDLFKNLLETVFLWDFHDVTNVSVNVCLDNFVCIESSPLVCVSVKKMYNKNHFLFTILSFARNLWLMLKMATVYTTEWSRDLEVHLTLQTRMKTKMSSYLFFRFLVSGKERASWTFVQLFALIYLSQQSQWLS